MPRPDTEMSLLKNESPDLENPAEKSKGQNPATQALSDHQIYEKLFEIKDTLSGESVLHQAIDGGNSGCRKVETCQQTGIIFGGAATVFGGAFSLATALDSKMVSITTSG